MQITDILDNFSMFIVGKEEVKKKVITRILEGGHIHQEHSQHCLSVWKNIRLL